MNLDPYLNVKTGKAFRDRTLKSLTLKEKIDKLDFMKIKNFCSVEGHHQQSEKVGLPFLICQGLRICHAM